MNNVFKAFFWAVLFLMEVGLPQVHAQQNHFVYLQSDDKQPFTAVINGKTFKASSAGYVIIPKLTDGKYPLVISFPNKKFPDQLFSFDVNKTDAGYALKNYGAKGWGLFNLQSLEITMAGETKDVAQTDGFGDMLSNAVNDTSLNIPPVKVPAKEEAVAKDITGNAPPAAAEQAAVIIVPKAQNAPENIPVAAAPAVATKKKGTKTAATDNSAVQKIAEQTTDDGINMVFIEKSTSGKDTVTIFLPSEKETQLKNTDSAIVEKVTANLIIADTVKPKPVIQKVQEINMPDTAPGSQLNNPFFKEETVAAKISTTGTGATEKKVEQNNAAAAEPAMAPAKQDCKTMLSDSDFEKLRKKLFSTTGNDKMIQASQKYLKDKCVTTAQIKILSGNFLSDEARFDFFSSAYPHVADMAEFASLQSQLIDPLYKKRFQAMLK